MESPQPTKFEFRQPELIKSKSIDPLCAWLPKSAGVDVSQSYNNFAREEHSIMDHKSLVESVMSSLVKKENPRRIIKQLMKNHKSSKTRIFRVPRSLIVAQQSVLKDEHAEIISKVMFNSEIRKSKLNFLQSDDITPCRYKSDKKESVWMKSQSREKANQSM